MACVRLQVSRHEWSRVNRKTVQDGSYEPLVFTDNIGLPMSNQTKCANCVECLLGATWTLRENVETMMPIAIPESGLPDKKNPTSEKSIRHWTRSGVLDLD